jgi:hypothetical protein
MITKIYTTGNYITVADVETITGLSKNVLLRKAREVNGEKYYAVINLPGRSPSNLIPFSDLRKEDDSPYTEQEWEDFMTQETGQSELNVMSEGEYTALTEKENRLYFTF